MLEALTILTLFGMFISILIGVVDRYALGLGLPWPEELGRFLLIWGSLLSAAVAAKRGQHFRLTLVSRHFGLAGDLVIQGATIIALLIVVWYGAEITWIFRVQRSPALDISMAWVYASAPVSAALMAAYVAAGLRSRLRSPVPPATEA
jgi:TRAP-type C4-dicarboxylate transport system permease small subunit